MRKEEDTSTNSDQEKTINTLKKIRMRITDMDDHFVDLGFVGCGFIFMCSGIFFLLNLIFGWLGVFSALLWSGIYVIAGVFVGFICSVILYYFSKNWFLCTLGYVLPLVCMVWILFPKLDLSTNIAIHAVFSVLLLGFSKKAINKKEREYNELRISSDLQSLLKDYDPETIDSDLCAMLDEAVHDRMDIHEKIYLINDHDDLLEGMELLEDVDDALCTLIKQAKTIMKLRERVSRGGRKEASGISSDDQLLNKINERVHQFTQKKNTLQELTIDVLEIDNEQIVIGIQALQKKRAEVALVEKTRKDLRLGVNRGGLGSTETP